MGYYNEIYHALENQPIINTHCHNHIDDKNDGWPLSRLLANTYCNISYPVQNIEKNPDDFFSKMGCNSYAYWLFQAYGKLYHQNEPLSAKNYSAVSQLLQQRYQEKGSDQYEILTEQCRYRAILLDDHLCPGNNHQKSLFQPSFRCDMFLHGYENGGSDLFGVRPYDYLTGNFSASFSEYQDKLWTTIEQRKKEMNCHALKIAIAYERDLHFSQFDETKADLAMRGIKSPENIRAFQDCTMDILCQISSSLSLPIQIHTGLGCLESTRALELKSLIQRHPHTKFVLLHSSYPWVDDAFALAHNYVNVYPDLSWLPLISTAAAEYFLRQSLDITDSHRLAWGCDTWTAQESYGALLALQHILAKVLSERVSEGIYSLSYAIELACRILWDNPKELYHFSNL